MKLIKKITLFVFNTILALVGGVAILAIHLLKILAVLIVAILIMGIIESGGGSWGYESLEFIRIIGGL